MSHARQQIRDAIATKVTGLTTSGARVYKSRVYPSGAVNLPGYCIYTLSDKLASEGDTLGQLQRWDLSVVIEARAKPSSATNLDEQLDLLISEAQTAMAGDPTLSGKVTHLRLVSVVMALSPDLERPAGMATMTWACSYTIEADVPGTLIYAS